MDTNIELSAKTKSSETLKKMVLIFGITAIVVSYIVPFLLNLYRANYDVTFTSLFYSCIFLLFYPMIFWGFVGSLLVKKRPWLSWALMLIAGIANLLIIICISAPLLIEANNEQAGTFIQSIAGTQWLIFGGSFLLIIGGILARRIVQKDRSSLEVISESSLIKSNIILAIIFSTIPLFFMVLNIINLNKIDFTSFHDIPLFLALALPVIAFFTYLIKGLFTYKQVKLSVRIILSFYFIILVGSFIVTTTFLFYTTFFEI